MYIHTNSAAAKESGQGVRSFAAAAAAANSPVTLPDLPYGYGELEPVISGGTDGRGSEGWFGVGLACGLGIGWGWTVVWYWGLFLRLNRTGSP